MDGFKNSTKTHYMKGGSCDGYAKGGKVKGAAKIAKVMGEFKSGALHSGSKKGPEVTNPKQAVAIALSEARKAGAKIPVKKYGGGRMSESTSSRPVDSKGRPISNEQLGVSARGAAGMTEAEKREYLKNYEAKLISPAEGSLWKRGASNAGYHYLGCAKTFALMGKAFAEALIKAKDTHASAR